MFYSTVKLSNTWQVSFLPSVKIMTNVRNYIFLACRLRWVNFIRLSCPIRAFIVIISVSSRGGKNSCRPGSTNTVSAFLQSVNWIPGPSWWDFFVCWSSKCYKWLVLNWRKYAIKNNSSNDLMRLMEALQFNSAGKTGCEAKLNTGPDSKYIRWL